MYAKNVGFPSGTFLLNVKQKKSMVDFAANLKTVDSKRVSATLAILMFVLM